MIQSSTIEGNWAGSLLYHRLYMNVADQPQERAFFPLIKAQSFQDCSMSLIVFRTKSDKNSRPRRPFSSPGDSVSIPSLPDSD